MNRYVALKVMKNDVPEWAHRHFRREARMCASFMHNNLVRVMQVGTTEEFDLLWFAMEYLRGKDVGWFVDSGTPMSIPVICEIFGQVLRRAALRAPPPDRPLRHQAVEHLRDA
jgi:serine/threonine protein kinase